MITKNELVERKWQSKDSYIWMKNNFNSTVTLNLETGQGNLIIYKSKYGKLELRFNINAFPGLSEIEAFCIKFIILDE